MMATAYQPIQILVVEDSPADANLTRRVFQRAKVSNNLHIVEDGVEALAFLHQQGKYTGVPRPDLILLDLNLPKKDGREVLAEIKTDLSLRLIPVIVLTTSDSEDDIIKSYQLHANCYITKPLDWQQFKQVVELIEDFWLKIVQRPIYTKV